MTYPVSTALTRRAWGGIVSAANEAGIPPDELCRQILQSAGISYADLPKHRVGVLTAGEFIDRFTSEELVIIRQAATQNAQVNQLKDQLLQRERVELDDTTLIGGLEQLAAVGLLQPNRPSELVAFVIPEPTP